MSDQVDQELESLRRAAEAGDASAQSELGRRYCSGRGVPVDNKQAITWLTKAATQGHADAQFRLGFLFLGKDGVKKDLEQAVHWFHHAVEQGDAGGMWGLGHVCEVKGDLDGAIKWYRPAAALGDPSAQFSLGTSYEFGDGVPKDHIEAVAWYGLAAEQNPPGFPEDTNLPKRRRDRLSRNFAQTQLEDAARRMELLRPRTEDPSGSYGPLHRDADAIAFRTDHFEGAKSETIVVVTTKLKLNKDDPAYDAARIIDLTAWTKWLAERTPGARAYSIEEVSDE